MQSAGFQNFAQLRTTGQKPVVVQNDLNQVQDVRVRRPVTSGKSLLTYAVGQLYVVVQNRKRMQKPITNAKVVQEAFSKCAKCENKYNAVLASASGRLPYINCNTAGIKVQSAALQRWSCLCKIGKKPVTTRQTRRSDAVWE